MRAFEVNKHVPDYLTGKKRIPSIRSDMITMGGEDEAVNYASANLNHWRKTPGCDRLVEVELRETKMTKQIDLAPTPSRR